MIETRTLELESKHGDLIAIVEYEYDPGTEGSYDERPDPDSVNIISMRIVTGGKEYKSLIQNLEGDLAEYEREGGGRYNPADDR